MLPGSEFLLYCVGTGTLLVSMAGALRLILGIERRRVTPEQRVTQREVPVDELEPDGGLARRLQEFQAARFASPIVQQTKQRVTIPDRRKTPKDTT